MQGRSIIPSECEIGDCAWYYLNAYNPGPAIIKRLVDVAVGQTLVMYTYGGYGEYRSLFRDILIGTISSWDEQAKYRIQFQILGLFI